MADADLDSRVRVRAFQFLREQPQLHGDEVLPREVLAKGPPGFTARGQESIVRSSHAPTLFLGVEQRALLVG
jgi:hypothetical protein